MVYSTSDPFFAFDICYKCDKPIKYNLSPGTPRSEWCECWHSTFDMPYYDLEATNEVDHDWQKYETLAEDKYN